MVWFSDTALLTPGSKVFFFKASCIAFRLYFLSIVNSSHWAGWTYQKCSANNHYDVPTMLA